MVLIDPATFGDVLYVPGVGGFTVDASIIMMRGMILNL
jgi:hypothetical protein